jgi:hypothetical protein
MFGAGNVLCDLGTNLPPFAFEKTKIREDSMGGLFK